MKTRQSCADWERGHPSAQLEFLKNKILSDFA
jgi:hypothetical protein